MTTKSVWERHLDGDFSPKYPPEPQMPEMAAYNEQYRAYQVECQHIRVECKRALLAALAEEHGLTNHPKLGLLQELVSSYCWGDDEICNNYAEFAALLKE